MMNTERPNQAAQRNAGSRPSSDDLPASETPSSLGPRGRSGTIGKIKMHFIAFVLLAAIAVVSGCAREPKFKAGDYIMPTEAGSPGTILKVAAVDKDSYRVFTHLIANGRLIQADDYLDVERTKTEQMHVVVAPPSVDGAFSPDRFLSTP